LWKRTLFEKNNKDLELENVNGTFPRTARRCDKTVYTADDGVKAWGGRILPEWPPVFLMNDALLMTARSSTLCAPFQLADFTFFDANKGRLSIHGSNSVGFITLAGE
jgi:hypothetical protein